MQKKPIFEQVFSGKFLSMPVVLQDRYANRSYSDDVCTVEGVLNVHTSFWMTLLSPFLRVFGALVPSAAKNIKVVVNFKSNRKNNSLKFDRKFYYQHRKPYNFVSTWIPQENDEVIEFMRFGLGWRMRCYFQDNRVHLEHVSFVWQMGRVSIPLPMHWLLGIPYAYEEAVDERHFRMHFEMIHPLLGNIFGYSGMFTMVKKVDHG